MSISLRSPEPIGLGSPEVEALSSYIIRLARWHSVLPGPLLHRFVAHLALEDSRFVGRWRRHTGKVRLAADVNGFGHAAAWIQALTRYTERLDLRDLSVCCTPIFAPRHVLAPNLKWCPDCLRDYRTPFHPLVWELYPTRVCRHHRRRLLESCPSCGRVIPVLHDRSSIVACAWCGRSLLLETSEATPASELELWVAEELGRFVAESPSAKLLPMSGGRLREMCRRHSISDPTALAVLLGTGKVTTWEWWRGNVNPSLPYALNICRVLGISLMDAITCRASSLRGMPSQGQLSLRLAIRHRPREIDWAAVSRALEAETRRPIEEAKSVCAIGRELMITPRTIRSHFPEQARVISQRFGSRKRLAAQKKFEALVREIHRGCLLARGNGFPVRQVTIARLLGKPTLFASPVARRAMAAALSNGSHVWPKEVVFPSLDRWLSGASARRAPWKSSR